MVKKRKKGSLIVEFVAILPLLVFVAWACLQIMFYVNAHAVLHQAAMDAARVAATELRGHVGSIASADAETKAKIVSQIQTKTHHVTKYNALILLYRDRNYGHVAPSSIPVELNQDCDEYLKNQPRGICIETHNALGNASAVTWDDNNEQIVVKIRAPFKTMGSFLPALENLHVYGQGSAVKEVTERYNYVPGTNALPTP